MRAIVTDGVGGPEVLGLGDLPDPEPGPTEILVATVAAGVNRADLMQRQGHYPPPPGAPETIGLEASGHVAAVGDDVRGWSIGDPCVALLAGGGYAERVAVPAGQVLPAPDLDLVSAGGVVEVAATVWSNLRAGRLRPGDTFLVHGGSGGIGSFAIQYAKALGATVITTAGSDAKLDYCRALGADVALSYRGDWAAGVAAATDGRGVEVILDNMGAKYLEANLGALALDGRLMIIGLQGGTQGTVDLGAMLAKRSLVHPNSLRARPLDQKAEICAGVLRDVWPMIADGTVQPTQETRIPLAEAARAHALLESGENTGKVILTV
ncbi:MAG: NAD(P)H-quinone oxidoreductase [Propionibacteriaceae bacterium]